MPAEYKKKKKKKTAREDTASKIKWEIRVKRKISGSIINTIRFSIQLSVGVIKVTVLAQPSFGISTVSPTNDNMIIACCKYYMCISFPLASVNISRNYSNFIHSSFESKHAERWEKWIMSSKVSIFSIQYMCWNTLGI